MNRAKEMTLRFAASRLIFSTTLFNGLRVVRN
jgi:hypothetical protein